MKTTKYLSDKSEKEELMLRLKQASNPFFSFLNPTSSLHNYYLFIKKNINLIDSLIELANNKIETDTKTEKEETKDEEEEDGYNGLLFGGDNDEFGSITVPPDDIRKCADKMAEYVFKHGDAFEEKIKADQKDNPSFAFLHQDNTYHSYFKWKVHNIKSNNSKHH